MNEKIILLDIDGVLNPFRSRRPDDMTIYTGFQNRSFITKPGRFLLRRLLRHKACVFWSSTWKEDSKLIDIALKLPEKEVIPIKKNKGETYSSYCLSRKNYDFIVIDDEVDFSWNIPNCSYIKPNPKIGITYEEIEELFQMLDL